MAKRADITPELLRQLLRYEPESGKLFWRDRHDLRSCDRMRLVGKEAFTTLSEGYRKGGVNNLVFGAHRVAWAIHYGKWPKGQVDHINGIKDDNRICNLRDVSCEQNQRNAKRAVSNTSGVTGISWHKSTQKWMAYICDGGKMVHLGRFAEKDAAIAARKAAEVDHGYHANHGRIVA